MVELMGRPLRALLGRAVMRGVVGRSRPWQAVLALIFLRRLFRLVSRPRPVVLRERLTSGEALEIRHLGAVTQEDGGPATGGA
ncbi:MAG: hypothetical protein P8M16_05330 [Acidimicrobiales bacterium]|nr:hypothetical protein [Acidimicrobiales bacterium]